MKWSSIVAISALAAVTSACEKHPASDLPPEFRGGSKHAETKHDPKPAAEHPEAAKPDPAKPVTDAKPGEAPKFFPENK